MVVRYLKYYLMDHSNLLHIIITLYDDVCNFHAIFYLNDKRVHITKI